jgi:hypothetical protein
VGCGALAAEASTVASLGAASVVVCPLSWPTSSPVVLDALAAGARVVVREGRRALGDEHPGLSGVERWLSRYRATGDLVAAVRGRAPGSCAGPPRTSAPGARASGDGLSGVQSSNTNRSAAARAAMGEYTLVERIRTIARAVVG